MLTKGNWIMIVQGQRDGKYLKDIAQEQGGASPDDPESSGSGKAGKSKLDPYKEWIDCRLGDGVWNAVVLYREVQELGYPGEITWSSGTMSVPNGPSWPRAERRSGSKPSRADRSRTTGERSRPGLGRR